VQHRSPGNENDVVIVIRPIEPGTDQTLDVAKAGKPFELPFNEGFHHTRLRFESIDLSQPGLLRRRHIRAPCQGLRDEAHTRRRHLYRTRSYWARLRLQPAPRGPACAPQPSVSPAPSTSRHGRIGSSWSMPKLPTLGRIAAPTAVLVRPDGYVAWVENQTEPALAEAPTTWFGPPTAAFRAPYK
jgi:hypothetical protein